MKLIPLTQGKFAQVDDEDYEWLNKFKWHAIKNRESTWYALNSAYIGNYKIAHIAMHRMIMGLKPNSKPIVDHKDRDGLNNQRLNLRFATYSQNGANKMAFGLSKYLGVHLMGRITKKWAATIQSGGKKIYLGCFEHEVDAAIAYDFAAIMLHGEFANINIK